MASPDDCVAGGDRKSVDERIGLLAAQAIDHIEEHYGNSARVGAVAIVCDVLAEDGKGQFLNPTLLICNEPRHWVTVGLVEEALAEAQERNQRRMRKVMEFEGLVDPEDDS